MKATDDSQAATTSQPVRIRKLDRLEATSALPCESGS